MNDRAVSLFEKYGIDAGKVRKGRSSLIAALGDRQVMLTEYNGPIRHLQMEYDVLCALQTVYDRPLDLIHKTTEDALFCVDYEGKKYILKEYVEGREADVRDPVEVRIAVDGLARLHVALRNTAPLEAADFEKEDSLIGDLDRHSQEMLRARNYIRKLPRRDEFELAFLSYFDLFYEQTKLVREFLDDECLHKLGALQRKEHMLIHGDCSHHNILIRPDGAAVVNFERLGAHLQVKDLCLYMRKVLEKNDWSFQVGENLLSAYEAVLPLSKEERTYLYARLLYPEKFWKVANGYLNRRKALPARRQHEKLSAALEKEGKRQLFLSKWLETCR